jgi:hypothetical protein
MNTPTMVASLIFAFVLVVLIGLVIRLMMRGWRHRGQLQEALIGTLPPVPDTVGPPTVAPTRGLYLGCTLAPKWNDRVVVGDLAAQQGRGDGRGQSHRLIRGVVRAAG